MASAAQTYDNFRPEMLPFVPRGVRCALEVGCSTGRFGEQLRAAHPEMELWGIDPTPHPEDRPQPYDTRIVGTFPEDVPVGPMFDCAVFNDVLEHMVDPWAALEFTRGFMQDGGHVVASIPNVRHIMVTKPLILTGRWDYEEFGILDRTHLRFFTRTTIVDLFESSGYEIALLEPIRVSKMGSLARVNRLARGRLTNLLAEQYAVVARPR